MSDSDGCGVAIGMLFCLTLGALGGYSITQHNVDEWWRTELSRRGHAHFYLDENNRRQWNWKEPKP